MRQRKCVSVWECLNEFFGSGCVCACVCVCVCVCGCHFPSSFSLFFLKRWRKKVKQPQSSQPRAARTFWIKWMESLFASVARIINIPPLKKTRVSWIYSNPNILPINWEISCGADPSSIQSKMDLELTLLKYFRVKFYSMLEFKQLNQYLDHFSLSNGPFPSLRKNIC